MIYIYVRLKLRHVLVMEDIYILFTISASYKCIEYRKQNYLRDITTNVKWGY